MPGQSDNSMSHRLPGRQDDNVQPIDSIAEETHEQPNIDESETASEDVVDLEEIPPRINTTRFYSFDVNAALGDGTSAISHVPRHYNSIISFFEARRNAAIRESDDLSPQTIMDLWNMYDAAHQVKIGLLDTEDACFQVYMDLCDKHDAAREEIEATGLDNERLDNYWVDARLRVENFKAKLDAARQENKSRRDESYAARQRAKDRRAKWKAKDRQAELDAASQENMSLGAERDAAYQRDKDEWDATCQEAKERLQAELDLEDIVNKIPNTWPA